MSNLRITFSITLPVKRSQYSVIRTPSIDRMSYSVLVRRTTVFAVLLRSTAPSDLVCCCYCGGGLFVGCCCAPIVRDSRWRRMRSVDNCSFPPRLWVLCGDSQHELTSALGHVPVLRREEELLQADQAPRRGVKGTELQRVYEEVAGSGQHATGRRAATR